MVDCEDVPLQRGPKRLDPARKLGKGELAPDDIPGLLEASDKLQNKDCAKAIGGSSVPWAESGLSRERYFRSYDPVWEGSSVAVAKASGFTVFLNTAIFFDPEHVQEIQSVNPDTGEVRISITNILTSFADQFGLNAAKLTAEDFQAIYLLHELGHSLGQLDADGPNVVDSDQVSFRNTQKVIDNCFKGLKR